MRRYVTTQRRPQQRGQLCQWSVGHAHGNAKQRSNDPVHEISSAGEGGGGSVRRGRFTSRMRRRVARVYVCVRQIGPERTPGAQLDSSRGVWRLARTCLAVVHGVASCGLCGMAWAMAWDGQPPRRSVPEQQGPHASEGRRGRTAGGLRWLGEWPACARAQRLLSHGDFLPRRQGRRVTRTAVHGAGHGATRLTCHETRVSSHD